MMRVPQWLWPSVERSEAEPTALPELANATSTAHLDVVASEIYRQQEREADRDRGAQARLIALLGLSSTLATVATALIGIGLSSDRIDANDVQLAALLLVLAYLALQFIAAMFHTAHGLLPREYVEINPEVFDPKPDETATVFRTAILSTHRSNLRLTTWSTNRRLDDMSCAIQAFRNAAVGSAVLLFVIAMTILNQRFGVCLPLPWP
ncbi:MAG: hypothetical protein Q8M65_01255 [Rhodoglobus sp.]|nr:hypothetical protein [Rhodoglobus sp.]